VKNMANRIELDLTTATAELNDAEAWTWEVQAQAGDGTWWVASESREMSEEEAEQLASKMRGGRQE
jgi:hypothetical protein